MSRKCDLGVPPSGSGHSPKGGAAKASPAKPSVHNAAHTPLPWGISYGFNLGLMGAPATYVAGPQPEHIGIKLATPWQEGAWDNDPEADANVAFIVRACNSHYELIEALAELQRCVEVYEAADHPTCADHTAMDEALEAATAALAKARGEQP